MPIDVDFNPKENLLSVCVVETDGSNIVAHMQNTSSQLTSVFLWGMHFHHDCADAGRQSRGLLRGNDVCKRCVSDRGMLMHRPSQFPPWTTNHWHSWVALTLMWMWHYSSHADSRAGIVIKLIKKKKTFCERKSVSVCLLLKNNSIIANTIE